MYACMGQSVFYIASHHHIISHIDDSRLTFSDLSMMIGREARRGVIR